MRKKLWLQFHLWTLGVVALLMIINVTSALRPLKPKLNAQTREPASTEATSQHVSTNADLKLAAIGCEPEMRLQLEEGVRQVRIQFEPCTAHKSDGVKGVHNLTNGFEATVFGASPKAGLAIDAIEPAEGTFLPAATLPTARKPAAVPIAISTDYITLAPGTNEVAIERQGRKQILRIFRN